MKTAVHDTCQHLSQTFGIAIDRFREYEHESEALYWIRVVWDRLENECAAKSDELIHDPTWGVSRTMLKKLREHANSSLILLISGNIASGEVVARSVMEGAVDVRYILNGDSRERCAQYLSSYVAKEREQCDKWERSLEILDESERAVHEMGLAQKRAVLDNYDVGLSSVSSEIGAPHDPSAKWPSVFERFKDVGQEVSYRTQYAALCIESHNAAEDLLNQLLAANSSDPAIPHMQAAEAIQFGRMMIHSAVTHFFRACATYGCSFELRNAVKSAVEAENVVVRFAASAGQSIPDLHEEVSRDRIS